MLNQLLTLFQKRKRNELEDIIGYKFKNSVLLKRALSHSSFTNEKGLPRSDCYERLEFLGDAVLGFLASEYVFKSNPDKAEGELTELKRILVSGKTLSYIANKIGLDDFIFLGSKEASDTENGHPAILADIYEALVGAIFLDGGLEPVKDFFYKYHFSEESFLTNDKSNINFKGRLLEFLQGSGSPPPLYKLERSLGPEHRRFYIVSSWSTGKLLGLGGGFSRKEAEQQAAERALFTLERKKE